jgi:hypothetical protein
MLFDDGSVIDGGPSSIISPSISRPSIACKSKPVKTTSHVSCLEPMIHSFIPVDGHLPDCEHKSFSPATLPHQRLRENDERVPRETLKGLCAECEGRAVVVETGNHPGAWNGLAKFDDDGDVKKTVHTS